MTWLSHWKMLKVWTLAIMLHTWVRLKNSSALQYPKWQLIGISYWYRGALCGHPLPALTDDWTRGAASRHTTAPISHTRTSPHSSWQVSYYSFPIPLTKWDGNWEMLTKREDVFTLFRPLVAVPEVISVLDISLKDVDIRSNYKISGFVLTC